MTKIVIIGGHGKIGLRAAKLLSARGDEVESWIRNADHSTEVEQTGAKAVVADVESLDTDQLSSLLSGHDAVVWSAGAGGGSPARTYAVDRDAAIRAMDAAAAAGVRRFVMVSYFYDRPDHGVAPDNAFFPYAEAKKAADDHLRASDLDWVILGPSRLTDEPGTGTIETGTGVTKSQVSRDDVAAVIAYVLATPTVSRRTVDFNDGVTPVADAVG